ncbi:lipoprotein LpqV [Rhodococcus daqingensis]|uniref:Lipoprotein LpqV n=1 Tax=Rhodococcus daqingensis TaxID=2479363 RepID=A0ABW2S4D4_9NOCA
MRMIMVVTACAAATALLAGCSSSDDGGTAEPVAVSSAASQAAASGVDEARAKLQSVVERPSSTSVKPSPAAGYEVSPAGVTTAVDVPPAMSGAEFTQTCQEALVWVSTIEGDPASKAEAMLGVLQADPVEFGGDPAAPDVWANGTPQMHADTIAAVNAAARGEC